MEPENEESRLKELEEMKKQLEKDLGQITKKLEEQKRERMKNRLERYQLRKSMGKLQKVLIRSIIKYTNRKGRKEIVELVYKIVISPVDSSPQLHWQSPWKRKTAN